MTGPTEVPRFIWLKALALWLLAAAVFLFGVVLVFWNPFFSTLYEILVHGWPVE